MITRRAASAISSKRRPERWLGQWLFSVDSVPRPLLYCAIIIVVMEAVAWIWD
jgi:hypothetical protein